MKRTILLSTLAVVLLAVPALADSYGTVNINETGASPRMTGKIYAPYTSQGHDLRDGLNVYIGKYHWNVGTASVDPNPFGLQGPGGIKTWGFCIEMELSDGWQTYNIMDVEDAPLDNGPDGPNVGMGSTKADYIRELWTAHIADTNTNLGAAAFQAAVWEIVYEDAEGWDAGSYDDKSGTWSESTFGTDNGTIASEANTYLDNILNNDYTLAKNIAALSNETYQDYVVEVPAPGAIVLGMMGLGLAGWVRKRIK